QPSPPCATAPIGTASTSSRAIRSAWGFARWRSSTRPSPARCARRAGRPVPPSIGRRRAARKASRSRAERSTQMNPVVLDSLREARAALDALIAKSATVEAIDMAGKLLAGVFSAGGRAFACGNGGSMCDAMHFAEELSGKYRLDRRALPAIAISDAGHLTCVGNDYGYEQVFSRYIEAHARAGDCLVAISTSGTSRNVV